MKSDKWVIICFSLIVVFTFVALLIKKVWYTSVRKQNFLILPKINIKMIANISMIIAIAVATIFIFMILSSNILTIFFRVYPGSRMQIEALLIRMGGLLFGPFIGIFIGASIDILTVILVSGIFHPGYFVAAMSYGFIGGIINLLILKSNKAKKHPVIFTILVSVFLIIIIIIVTLFLQISGNSEYTVLIFAKSIKLTKSTIQMAIVLMISAVLVLIWIMLLIKCFFKAKRNTIVLNSKKHGTITFENTSTEDKNNNWFIVLTISLLVNISSQSCVDVIMLPFFDETISTLPYDSWLISRMLFAMPIVFVNSFITYFIFKIIYPVYSKLEDDEKIKKKKNIILLIQERFLFRS